MKLICISNNFYYYQDKEQKEYDKLKPLTNDQQKVFDKIINAINNQNDEDDCKMFFLQGNAGSGKTHVAIRLIRYCRSQGINCSGCASTGLATQNYPQMGFSTAHTLFKVPVVREYERDIGEIELDSHLSQDHIEFLCAMKVFIWEEATANHKEVFLSASKSVNHFKGKVLVLIGDFKQGSPVVIPSFKADVINASIVSLYQWNQFEHFFLSENIRLKNDKLSEEEKKINKEYADLLIYIGHNKIYRDSNQNILLNVELVPDSSMEYLTVKEDEDEDSTINSSRSSIPTIQYETQKVIITNPDTRIITIPGMQFKIDDGTNPDLIDDMVKFLYPNGQYDPKIAETSAVIAYTNKDVNEWNTIISKLNTNNEEELISKDVFHDIDDERGTINGNYISYIYII
jgi:hypothetical protein